MLTKIRKKTEFCHNLGSRFTCRQVQIFKNNLTVTSDIYVHLKVENRCNSPLTYTCLSSYSIIASLDKNGIIVTSFQNCTVKLPSVRLKLCSRFLTELPGQFRTLLYLVSCTSSLCFQRQRQIPLSTRCLLTSRIVKKIMNSIQEYQAELCATEKLSKFNLYVNKINLNEKVLFSNFTQRASDHNYFSLSINSNPMHLIGQK